MSFIFDLKKIITTKSSPNNKQLREDKLVYQFIKQITTEAAHTTNLNFQQLFLTKIVPVD